MPDLAEQIEIARIQRRLNESEIENLSAYLKMSRINYMRGNLTKGEYEECISRFKARRWHYRFRTNFISGRIIRMQRGT